ncbi:winged helix-turn-helix domain-containing protein [Variovorax sp. KK3]|uniref:ATP-binding protein n=1 Tax=Variovorax sp. KK3 TaxID=1855728 RepID=UPI00097C2E66|nr:winged helix-turn-helix domain-containing protein [Variovorax sp. KK3]
MAEPPSNGAVEQAFLFGPFRLLPAQQLLLEGSAPVRVGSRALEILNALVERPGELVPKNELMARAWPRTVVEESNLKVTVAALRRALGDGRAGQRYVINIPGRGYRFVAPVLRMDAGESGTQGLPAGDSNLPYGATRVFGRADVVAALAAQLPQRRFVSIVGPGGIGKTTVAIAVAEALGGQCEHGAHFVDLAPLLDARFVPMAIAKALGLAIHSGDALPIVLGALRDRRMLIVLDSCEHVLHATAAWIEQILAAAPGVLVLTTTREPLRARAETVHRLAALGAPPASDRLTAGDALAFPAVELFVERASACLESFAMSDADASVVADICRKLEGIPLAIELTATRADAFTLRELSALLDNRFRLLALDRRGASSRHRSLSAALDWSHELLQDGERTVLRRLSVFAGTFALASAEAVAGGDADVALALEGLVAKSLVCADVSGVAVRYRLLDTMRAYAAQKLSESGELADLRQRHARHLLDVLTRAELESHQRRGADWTDEHAPRIDDVRGALAWAFSVEGKLALGIQLTIAAIPLWTQLSLLDECRVNVERALASECPGHPLDASGRMKLCAALGQALLYTQGPQARTDALLKEALAIADEAGDVRYQLRMLWALPVYLVFAGQNRAALGYLRRLRTLARRNGDSADELSAERLIATALHYFGRHSSARRRLDVALARRIGPVQQSHISRFQFDQRGAARGTLANLLWLQGFAEQAERMAALAVDDALESHHPLSLCSTLGNTSFPIAFCMGDLEAAERHLRRLREHLERNALEVWRSRADFLESMLMSERGDPGGADRMADALLQLQASGFLLRRSYFLCALARGLSLAGRHPQARATLDGAIAWCGHTGEHWYLPEVLRLKGELVRGAGGGAALREAETLYRQSLGMAQGQGALAWSLRSATSLAELCIDLGRHDEAAELLDAVLLQFTEGFETADLFKAGELASRLRIANAA